MIFLPEYKGRCTVDSLPPDHQAGEAQKNEDTPKHSFPLFCFPLHLRVGLAEHDPIHCRRDESEGRETEGRDRGQEEEISPVSLVLYHYGGII